MAGLTMFQRFQGNVDRNTGIVAAVSIITEGEAKGHSLLVDNTTLQQIKASASTYKNGVKVKLDHGSGISAIVGYLQNFRIEGNKLLGDLHLLKSHEDYNFILDLATEIPDTFGISVSFSGDTYFDKEGQAFARCNELYSADIVSEPAANPSGLFEKPVDIPNKSEPPTQFIHMTNTEANEAINKAIEPLLAKISELEKKLETKQEVKQLSEERIAELVTLAVNNAVSSEMVKHFSKAGVSSVPPAPVEEPKKEEPKTFEQLVQDQVTSGKSKSDAIRFCIKTYSKEYQEATKRGITSL